MFDTLVEMFEARKASQASVQVMHATDQIRSHSFAELYDNALKRLGDLQGRGLSKGGHCILYMYDEVAFLEGFWACILGGIIPVPVAPGNTPEHKNKLLLIATELSDAIILTENAAIRRFEGYAVEVGADDVAHRVVLFEALDVDDARAVPHFPDPEDVAYIQFSSGSTRQPKGVVLTHRNLVTNIVDLNAAFGFTPDAIALSWMPLTHDMGLIGFHLCPLYAGIEHHILRTALFVRRPLVWLQHAADVGATTLGSPNFGYRHWLKAQEKSNAPMPDLSSVRQIINGAEPISSELVDAFMSTLAPAGLPAGAMCPSYGLAEASLGISVAKPGEGLRAVHLDRTVMQMHAAVPYVAADHATAVSFPIEGFIFPHSQLRIATHYGRDLGQGVLGDIQIKGDNVTAGYLNNAEANDELFTPDGWLRTGDLGFLHHDELVVTGRTKDMIVTNGQNYFAHDIEMIIEQHGFAETGEVAASVLRSQSEEHFVLFLRERAPDTSFVARAEEVRKLIYARTGLTLIEVVPVRTIPKTTSGKIRRASLAVEFVTGVFDTELTAAYGRPPLPRTEFSMTHKSTTDVVIEKLTAMIAAENLPSRDLNPSTRFFDVGLSSINLAELTDELNETYRDVVEVTDFFELESVETLAQAIEERLREEVAA